jgi:hypothetical protein
MDLIPTTQLMAVNAMLRAIGESPINSLNSSGSVDAVMALQTLEAVSRELQERGWHWNTLENLKLSRSFPSNEIQLPQNTLKVDSMEPDEEIDVIQRGKRLFNRKTNSFVFDRDITVTLVECLDWDDLPQAARTFVTHKAGLKFQADRVGSETLYKFQAKDVDDAWNRLVSADAETRDANIFDNWSVARVLDR